MQIKLGDKIKELRKRDGRKQEDLAVALGVTNQAVSRWEANGGCPDIEMLPSIANYFHVTIDELFGYDNDRQIKLQSYIDKADQMLKHDDGLTLVKFLRDAISEFPSEWQLQYRLANSLIKLGGQRRKTHVTNGESGEYFCHDTKNNAENEYWKEAVALLEEVLKKEIDDNYRAFAVSSLISLYSLMGDFENAERTALSQSPLRISREVLLAGAAEEGKGDSYRGEAILALMHELTGMIGSSVMMKHSLANAQSGLDKLLAVAHLNESVIDDGKFGVFHNDLCLLYLRCYRVAVNLNDYDRALNYFETALDHFLKFKEMKKDFRYTAEIVAKVKNVAIGLYALDREIFEDGIKALPPEYANAVKNNPKYVSIFSK